MTWPRPTPRRISRCSGSSARRSDEAVAALALDHTITSPRSGRQMDLRWIYLHMIEEYARHNGHADMIRERIDGVTGD